MGPGSARVHTAQVRGIVISGNTHLAPGGRSRRGGFDLNIFHSLPLPSGRSAVTLADRSSLAELYYLSVRPWTSFSEPQSRV